MDNVRAVGALPRSVRLTQQVNGDVNPGTHFGYPLGHESLRRNDQDPLDEPTQFQFTKNESSFYGFPESDLVGQQVTNPISRNSARQGLDLVRKGNN